MTEKVKNMRSSSPGISTEDRNTLQNQIGMLGQISQLQAKIEDYKSQKGNGGCFNSDLKQTQDALYKLKRGLSTVGSNVYAKSASQIATHIDDLANRLEARGLVKEAQNLDVISNTLEKLASVGSLPSGRLKSDAEIKEKYEELKKHTSSSEVDLKDSFVVSQLEDCAKNKDYEDLSEYYPGWGTEDFEALLKMIL